MGRIFSLVSFLPCFVYFLFLVALCPNSSVTTQILGISQADEYRKESKQQLDVQ